MGTVMATIRPVQKGTLFPNNADQWQDRDGDGYGDNMQGQDGDMFPDEPTQWADETSTATAATKMA